MREQAPRGSSRLWGMVLAAGKGSRLAPITDWLPKPALPLAGFPLAGLALLHLHRAGVERAAINVHHLAPRMRLALEPWQATHLHRMALGWSEETELLGTGGGLRRALELGLVEAPLLVVNSDALCDVDCAAFARQHEDSGADASLLLFPHPEAQRFGLLRGDEGGCLVDLAGLWKDDSAQPSGPSGVFTGISILGPAVFAQLARGPEQSCLVRQGLLPLLEQGGRVQVVEHRGRWQDLGTVERLLDGQSLLLSGDWPIPVASSVDPWEALAYGASSVRTADGRSRGTLPCREAGVHWVAPGVSWEANVRLGDNVVVGPGVRVGEGARLNNCLLLAGCRVAPEQRVDGAILGRFGGKSLLVSA